MSSDSIVSSFVAALVISEIWSAKLCSSMENRFSKVKVLGSMSKVLPVIFMSCSQCLCLSASFLRF